MPHELQRIAQRAVHVAAEQGGERLAAAVEVDGIELRAGRFAQHGYGHDVSRAASRECVGLGRLGLGILDEILEVLPRGVRLHEEDEIIQHDVHDGLNFAEGTDLRIEQGRDLHGTVDQNDGVRIGSTAAGDVTDADGTATARLVDQGDRDRHQLFLGDHLVDHARHDVGAAVDREGHDELDVACRLPLGGSG